MLIMGSPIPDNLPTSWYERIEALEKWQLDISVWLPLTTRRKLGKKIEKNEENIRHLENNISNLDTHIADNSENISLHQGFLDKKLGIEASKEMKSRIEQINIYHTELMESMTNRVNKIDDIVDGRTIVYQDLMSEVAGVKNKNTMKMVDMNAGIKNLRARIETIEDKPCMKITQIFNDEEMATFSNVIKSNVAMSGAIGTLCERMDEIESKTDGADNQAVANTGTLLNLLSDLQVSTNWEDIANNYLLKLMDATTQTRTFLKEILRDFKKWDYIPTESLDKLREKWDSILEEFEKGAFIK